MALIDEVKTNLRISGNVFDEHEINPLIEACKKDLKISGVHESRINDDDALIKRAIIIFCKANFGDNPNSEKFRISYELQKASLAVSQDYNLELIPDD